MITIALNLSKYNKPFRNQDRTGKKISLIHVENIGQPVRRDKSVEDWR